MNLKKCPFCGQDAELVKDRLWSEGRGYYGHYNFSIQCSNWSCSAKPKAQEYNTVYGKSNQECIDLAVASWNTRAE